MDMDRDRESPPVWYISRTVANWLDSELPHLPTHDQDGAGRYYIPLQNSRYADAVHLLLKSDRLSPEEKKFIQRVVQEAKVPEDAKTEDIKVDNLRSFLKHIKWWGDTKEPQIEMQLGGRWYPIQVSVDSGMTMRGLLVQLSTTLQMGRTRHKKQWHLMDDHFQRGGERVSLHISEILKACGLRLVQSDMRQFRMRCDKATELTRESEAGTVMEAVGSGVVIGRMLWFSNLQTVPLGSKEAPIRVIFEPTLEGGDDEDDDGGEYGPCIMPMVRVFSMQHKGYCFVDVDDIQPVVWDEQAADRLILPDGVNTLIKRLFTADQSKIFGDTLKGKHGGIIILASGSPGTGKTLTAETFAEVSKRPLYVAEIGELGLDLGHIERGLQRVFKRVTKWNAVLLLDEADIFLAKRDNNLERSAIVGVFLRLLDYYQGTLFLTTNRTDVIDEAFRSRITLKLNYPQLDRGTRLKIWNIMLEKAGIQVDGDLDRVVEVPMNGRQIRNMVRLALILYPEGRMTNQQLHEVCQFTAA